MFLNNYGIIYYLQLYIVFYFLKREHLTITVFKLIVVELPHESESNST